MKPAPPAAPCASSAAFLVQRNATQDPRTVLAAACTQRCAKAHVPSCQRTGRGLVAWRWRERLGRVAVALALHTAKSPDPRTVGAPCRTTGEASAAGCAVRRVSGLLGAAQCDAGPAHRARGGVHAALREGHRAPRHARGEVCCTPPAFILAATLFLKLARSSSRVRYSTLFTTARNAHAAAPLRYYVIFNGASAPAPSPIVRLLHRHIQMILAAGAKGCDRMRRRLKQRAPASATYYNTLRRASCVSLTSQT